MMQKLIGEVLIELGCLDHAGLGRALDMQQQIGGRLGDILRQLGLISDHDWANALSTNFGLPMVSLSEYPEKPMFADEISEEFLTKSKIVPLGFESNGLVLAMADPLDLYAIEAMELVAKMTVLPKVGCENEIAATLERLYPRRSDARDYVADETVAASGLANTDIERLKDMASEEPVIRLVNQILRRAIDYKASDIHIEPYESSLVARYRVDGVLRLGVSPPVRMSQAIISRIKIMANLDIAERRLPQDGRMRIRIQGMDVDIRVSTLPTLYGESVALRILEQGQSPPELDALGFRGEARNKLLSALDASNGVLLVTGPTGSGKTTTLYAALAKLHTLERKILTVEDPVEYQLENVTQVQVNADIGLSFSNVLRSMLRHDPDVIMVGEMRDTETARIAIQSALTGHLVFSTLHTNDAASAITRLLDMGIEDYLIVSTVQAVVGQRLVRTLCAECRMPYQPSNELIDQIGLTASSQETLLYRPVGCKACADLGYVGRVAIVEVLEMTESVHDLILRRAGRAELVRAAEDNGMVPMYLDGIQKALQGVTTIEEVRRVTREQ